MAIMHRGTYSSSESEFEILGPIGIVVDGNVDDLFEK